MLQIIPSAHAFHILFCQPNGVFHPRGVRPSGDGGQGVDGFNQRLLGHASIMPAHIVHRMAQNLILDMTVYPGDHELRRYCVACRVRAYSSDTRAVPSPPDRGFHLPANVLPVRVGRATGAAEQDAAPFYERS